MSKKLGLAWYGGKMHNLKLLYSLMPTDIYHLIDLFGGGGSVSLNAYASMKTYNDLDNRVYTFFKVCRERPEELQRMLEWTLHSQREHAEACEAMKSEPPESGSDAELEYARQFLVVATQSFARLAQTATTKQFSFAGARANGKAPPPEFESLTDSGACNITRNFVSKTSNLHRLAGELRKMQVMNEPALRLIERADSPHAFFYADPPYVHSTRTSSNEYSNEMTDEDHRELCEALNGIEGRAMVSGYPSALYDELLKGWRAHTFEKLTAKNGKRTEVVWMNYDDFGKRL